MKNFISFLLLLAMVQIGQSQCPQNTIPGSTIDVFDWTAETFDMYIFNYPEAGGNNPPYEIPSPFYSAGPASAQFNTDHFATEIPIDNNPIKGWELIFYDFGTSDIYVDEPSFALYNRYNGLLRFFMLISSNGESPYQEAFISAYIDELGDVFYNSALLESQNAIHHSLEDFEKQLSINSGNRFSNSSSGTWIVSEWLTHYDPCTCLSTMQLKFSPKLQNIQEVTLNIDGTTSTVPIYKSSMNYNNGSIRSAIGTVGTNIENLSNSYKKGNEIYKNFDKFESVIEKSIKNGTLNEESPAILKNMVKIATGISTGNYLAVAAGLIGGVNTFVKSSSTKTIASYSSKHTFNAEGTIETNAPYDVSKIYLPGSNHEGYIPSLKPIYDNILGIASIIETPKFDFIEEEMTYVDDCPGGNLSTVTETFQYYKLREDLKYSINTSAGIKNMPLDSKASLYFDFESNGNCDGQVSYIDYFMEKNTGLIKVSETKWRTPFMNLSCLKEYPVTFQVGITDNCSIYDCGNLQVSPYLAFALVLESNDNQEIAHLKSYKIGRYTPTYNWNDRPQNDFLGIPESVTIDIKYIQDAGETWGTTTVTGLAGKAEIIVNNEDGYSTIIQLDDDNDPSTDGTYTTNEFTIDCGEVLPVSTSYLADFCQNKYDAIVELGLDDETIKVRENRENVHIKIMPNPVIDNLTIEHETTDMLNYRIFNSVGQLVLEGELNNSTIFLGNLNRGMYIIQLFDNQILMADQKLIKL